MNAVCEICTRTGTGGKEIHLCLVTNGRFVDDKASLCLACVALVEAMGDEPPQHRFACQVIYRCKRFVTEQDD